MKASCFLAAAILLCTAPAIADESVCGVTTHGMPLKTKAAALDWQGNADKLFAALGPSHLHVQRDEARIMVWYDIKRIRSGTPQNYAGTDCGVMLALTTKGTQQTLTMKSLLAADIDLLLSGKVPSF